MISFPSAKINLGLQVRQKRPDGFHDISTIFYPTAWHDALEVLPGGNQPLTLTMSGLKVTGVLEKNLCFKAWQLLSNDFAIPPLKIHLHKTLPMGAGLGGGSSDGAATLKLINTVCQLRLSEDQLLEYAAQLGSDCAFFILNSPAYATGRGEILESFPPVLAGYFLVIAMPKIAVRTADAFQWVVPNQAVPELKSIVNLPIEEWKGHLVNDFEVPIGERFPLIPKLIQLLYQEGAIYAAMSGSGAAVYGIFNKATSISLPETQIWQGQL